MLYGLCYYHLLRWHAAVLYMSSCFTREWLILPSQYGTWFLQTSTDLQIFGWAMGFTVNSLQQTQSRPIQFFFLVLERANTKDGILFGILFFRNMQRRCQDQISGMLDSSLQEMHSEELGLCGFHLLPGREKCVLKKKSKYNTFLDFCCSN